MKKGFTLIELLAVIVILAIIALIATPIILGIINDAREKANERSVELYASAVRNAVAAYQLTALNAPKSFSDLDIQYDGDVVCSVEKLYSDGSFYLEGCKVNDSEKTYSYGTKLGCELEDIDGDGVASLSDVVTCGTESFYVMYNENNEITMLSMYNLYVGKIADMDTWETTPLENPTGIQNEKAKAFVDGDPILYGITYFSKKYYWQYEDEETGIELSSQYGNEYPVYVYDEHADGIYPYVSSYEDYLKQNGVKSAEATLINMEQLIDLHCSLNTTVNGGCKNAPSWVFSTSYWTGIVSDHGPLFVESDSGYLGDTEPDNAVDIFNGVRPVITISTSEIQ